MSTMYRCCLFVTLVAITLGAELLPIFTGSFSSEEASSRLSTSTPHAPPQGLADLCFVFNTFPSASCRFKCHLRNMHPYCDEDLDMCLCRKFLEGENHSFLDIPLHNVDLNQTASHVSPPLLKNVESPSTTPSGVKHPQNETDDDSYGSVLFVFDLGRLFALDNVNSTPDTIEDLHPYSTKLTPWMAPAHWSFQHLMALLIIFLLCVLIALELWSCYRRQNSKQSMDNIFRSISVTDKA